MRAAELSLIAVAAMVTYATRAGGPLLGGVLARHSQVESLVGKVSLCLLAALAAVATIGGDTARFSGLAAATAAMLLTRNTPAALATGAATAGTIRFLAGG